MTHKVLIGAVLLLLCTALLSQVLPSNVVLHISSFMTAQEMRDTGVVNMTQAQRDALDRWLTKYSMGVMMSMQKANGKAGGGTNGNKEYNTGKGHWVESVSSNGKIVTLEDDSVWEIAIGDQIDTSLWLPTTDITVLRDLTALSEYKYILLNTEDGEKAHAKFLGKN